MARDIDLIPASYKERLKIQRWCHIFFMVIGAIVVVTGLLRFSLSSNHQSIQTRITALQRDKSFNLEQLQKYNDLLAVERRVQKNLEILEGLRGGPPVRQILMVIDRVLNGNVWFLQWSFKRAHVITDVQPETVQTGYFIIIPQENSQTGRQQTWKLDTHMEIKGQARDHSSFSAFVQELLNQPEIEDVKVVNTQVRRYVDTEVIDFNIVVIINNQQSERHV